jgi:hypothetical protein
MNMYRGKPQQQLFTMLPGAEPEQPQEKRCSACGESWPLDVEFFKPGGVGKGGWSARCIACIKGGVWRYKWAPD